MNYDNIYVLNITVFRDNKDLSTRRLNIQLSDMFEVRKKR